MTVYYLYAHDRCDRCGGISSARTVSFFTDETICLACLAAEDGVKDALRRRGVDVSALESCGTLPRLESKPVRYHRLAPTDRAAPQLTAADVRAALRRLRERELLVRIPPAALPPGRDRRSTG